MSTNPKKPAKKKPTKKPTKKTATRSKKAKLPKKPKDKGFPAWDGAVMIPLDKLVPTHWNANEMADPDFASLVHEINTGGFDEPCQVVPIESGDDKGKYLVIGGEHRYKTGIANDSKSLPCVIKTHLDPNNEADLMIWSVQRNNIRGKLNEQKYMKIQDTVTDRLGISREAAQRRMNMREELMKKATRAVNDEAVTGDSVDSHLGGPQYDTDGARDSAKNLSDRNKLMMNLKEFAEEVLFESGDTVEHGYLFFGQSGKEHLVVEESKNLYVLISKLVSVCRNNSDSINDFFVAAIRKELPKWE